MQNGELQVSQYVQGMDDQVISPSVSSVMREMLHDTRSVYAGTDPDGYYIGGKTGTGQVYLEETGAYSAPDGETTATYLGFGGTEGELPKYVIMVKMWGEGRYVDTQTECLPVFDSISNYLQDYLKIKPKGN